MTAADAPFVESPDVKAFIGPSGHRRVTLGSILVIAIIIVATIATLWPVVTCNFTIRDDDLTVSANELMTSPGFRTYYRYWTWPAWGLYAPIPYTVWATVAFFARSPDPSSGAPMLNPAAYHATNLGFHVLTAVVAWLVLRRLLRSDWAACAGALLFALHPVQVEPVAWVSGLKDVLAGFFSLIAIWQYLLYLDAPLASTARRVRYLFMLAATAAAILSKVSSAMLPFMLVAIDWLVVRRPLRDVLRSTWPIFVCCLPPVVAARFIQLHLSEDTLWERTLTSLDVISFYVIKVVWPTRLVPDYNRPPQVVLRGQWLWACWIIPLVAGIILLLVRKSRPMIVAGAILFIAGIAPVLGMVPFAYQTQSTVSDHYLYTSMFGVAMIVADLLSRGRYRILLGGACAAWLVALAILSHRQTRHWHDTFTLYSYTVRANPSSWRSDFAIANLLLKQKQYAAANEHYLASIKITPTAGAYVNFASSRMATGRADEALKLFREAVRLDPQFVDGYLGVASAYLSLNRAEEGLAEAKRAYQMAPNDDRARQMVVAAEELVRRGSRSPGP